MDYDEDPLDLFEDDGDGVREMCTLLDNDDQGESPPKTKSGCCVLLFILGMGGATAGHLIINWI